MADILTIAKSETRYSLRRVIPDLVGVPLYLAARSEVPERLGGSMVKSGCGGAHHETLDLALQEHFIKRDEWRGRGVCFYLDDIGIFKNSYSPEHGREVFRAVAVHETCHAIAADTWPSDLPDDKQHMEPLAMTDGLAFWCQIFQPEKPGVPSDLLKRWTMHGPKFIRASIHVVGRLITLRDGLDLNVVGVAGSYYGLTHPHTYAAALGDEVDRCAGRPIREVLAEPLPEAFAKLWAADTEGATDRSK